MALFTSGVKSSYRMEAPMGGMVEEEAASI